MIKHSLERKMVQRISGFLDSLDKWGHYSWSQRVKTLQTIIVLFDHNNNNGIRRTALFHIGHISHFYVHTDKCRSNAVTLSFVMLYHVTELGFLWVPFLFCKRGIYLNLLEFILWWKVFTLYVYTIIVYMKLMKLIFQYYFIKTIKVETTSETPFVKSSVRCHQPFCRNTQLDCYIMHTYEIDYPKKCYS